MYTKISTMEAMKMMRPYLNSYRYEERSYRLLRELLDDSFSYHVDNIAGEWHFTASLFDGFFPDTEGDYDDLYDDPIADEMLNKYVIPRYYNWAIGWIDGEEPEAQED